LTPTETSYILLGLGLTSTGVALSSTSYFILRSTPLTALGISTIILGMVSLALGRSQPKIPPEASTILLESGLENISAIIEELGLTSKAIYLPSSMTSGQPQALIPIHQNPYPPKPKTTLPKRLIVKYAPNPEDIGLLITTPGSTVTNILGSKPGPAMGDLEAALSSVLTGTIDLADAIKVTMGDGRIIVEVSNPRLEYRSMRVYECLGSPIASMVASIATEALDKAVVIDREEHKRGKLMIELKVLE